MRLDETDVSSLISYQCHHALVVDLDIFARKLVILLSVLYCMLHVGWRPDALQSRVIQYTQITDTVQQYTATHENILKLVNINRL